MSLEHETIERTTAVGRARFTHRGDSQKPSLKAQGKIVTDGQLPTKIAVGRRPRRDFLLLALIAACSIADPEAIALAASADAITPPTPAALQNFRTIDAMEVERHWPAGVHVDWETGIPDGRPLTLAGKHTHCSAFAASAAERLGVYILRPPEHSQTLLANAQYDWLAREGTRRGWVTLTDAIDAQNRANLGDLVVAVYRNHDDDKPGHIAIVRPGDKSVADIERDGPQVTQAGSTNHRSITLRLGFAGHPLAWEGHEVRFYAHAVKPNN
jgi:hypothetical protein